MVSDPLIESLLGRASHRRIARVVQFDGVLIHIAWEKRGRDNVAALHGPATDKFVVDGNKRRLDDYCALLRVRRGCWK